MLLGIMKTLLTLFILFFSSSIYSKPVWESNENLICNSFLHTIINKTGTVEGINQMSNTITFSFDNNKAMSGFGNSTGHITEIDYTESDFGNVNLLRVDWDFGFVQYFEIQEINNSYYFSGSSGYGDQDDLIYSVHYKCN